MKALGLRCISLVYQIRLPNARSAVAQGGCLGVVRIRPYTGCSPATAVAWGQEQPIHSLHAIMRKVVNVTRSGRDARARDIPFWVTAGACVLLTCAVLAALAILHAWSVNQ